jgi:membrane-bound metal-dependent hydrolase YbcI (DUF457 family)
MVGASTAVTTSLLLSPIAGLNPYLTAGLSVVPAIIASYLPDLDQVNSKAGKKVRTGGKWAKVAAAVTIIADIIYYYFMGSLSDTMLLITVIAIIAMLIGIVLAGLPHRGPTHSAVIPIAAFFTWKHFSYMFNAYVDAIMYGVFVGYSMHIIADLLYGKGCMLFWPFSSSHINVADIKYDGFVEKIVAYGSIVVGLGLIVYNVIK